MNVIDLLELTDEQKQEGVWFSGIEGKGEYKRWNSNGQLGEHTFWKNGEYHGECKWYLPNGRLWIHKLYENGIMIEDYLKDKQ